MSNYNYLYIGGTIVIIALEEAKLKLISLRADIKELGMAVLAVTDGDKELAEKSSIYLHRNMRIIKSDTMLVIIPVGRILKRPSLTANSDGNMAEILPCRVSRVTCKPCILNAELALGVARSLCISRSCNISGVLFRL